MVGWYIMMVVFVLVIFEAAFSTGTGR